MIEYALKLAEKARHKCHKHAAIVMRGGAIISIGVNHDEIHAEVQALKALWPSERKDTRVFVVRLTRGGRLGLSKPCPACQAYMRAAGVKSVDYSTNVGTIERMKL